MEIFIAGIPLLAGFLLDCAFGDPIDKPHPVRLIGKLISALEKAARKLFPNRLFLGGLLLSVIVLLLSLGVSAGIIAVCSRINMWLGIAAESVMCYYLLAARCLRDESMKVYAALNENDTEKARNAVSMIVGRDTKTLDLAGIIRAAVETVAENTSDGITAPMFYIMIGGAPLGFLYKAANTMDSMIGYKNEKYKEIGCFAAKLDDVLNFIPSRLTAVIMILSAGIMGLDMKSSYKIWRRDRRKHDSPNSAQTESVCAGALNVRLAGDAYYFGELHKKEYIGDDTRPIESEDIRLANTLMYITSVISVLLFLMVRIIIFGVINL